MPNQPPNQRLRDIGITIEYARQKLTENLQFQQQSACLATLLAGCAMSQAHPSETATERAVNASWDRNYRWFLARTEGFARNVTPEHLRRGKPEPAASHRRQRKGRLLSAQESAFFAVFWAPQGHCGPGFIRWRRCGR